MPGIAHLQQENITLRRERDNAEARIRALEAENATLGIKLSNLHDENAALKQLVLEYSQSDDYITDSPGQCTCGLCQRARQLLGEDVQG